MRTIVSTAAAALLLTLFAGCGGRPASPGVDDGQPAAAAPELACPPQWEGGGKNWVPRQAPEGLASRLVPAGMPVDSVLCRYDGSNLKPFKNTDLSWHATPTRGALSTALGGFRRLGQENADEQLMCTLIGGPQRNYLLGMRYQNAVVWVSGADDPNGCVPTSNGRFTTNQSAKSIFESLASATS